MGREERERESAADLGFSLRPSFPRLVRSVSPAFLGGRLLDRGEGGEEGEGSSGFSSTPFALPEGVCSAAQAMVELRQGVQWSRSRSLPTNSIISSSDTFRSQVLHLFPSPCRCLCLYVCLSLFRVFVLIIFWILVPVSDLGFLGVHLVAWLKRGCYFLPLFSRFTWINLMHLSSKPLRLLNFPCYFVFGIPQDDLYYARLLTSILPPPGHDQGLYNLFMSHPGDPTRKILSMDSYLSFSHQMIGIIHLNKFYDTKNNWVTFRGLRSSLTQDFIRSFSVPKSQFREQLLVEITYIFGIVHLRFLEAPPMFVSCICVI